MDSLWVSGRDIFLSSIFLSSSAAEMDRKIDDRKILNFICDFQLLSTDSG